MVGLLESNQFHVCVALGLIDVGSLNEPPKIMYIYFTHGGPMVGAMKGDFSPIKANQ
jgi:hypothetical protein